MQDIVRESVVKGDEESTFRPLTLDDFTGQSEFIGSLGIFIRAARRRGEPLDHVLFYGPPGLGKTTLSRIIAHEMGASLKVLAAPTIQKPGDLVSVLVSLEPQDVLFIDEIHRLPKIAEEVLYGALEDRKITILVGPEEHTRPVEININPFTLVAATTLKGLIAQPLSDRFGISFRLDYYPPEDLARIVSRASEKSMLALPAEAVMAIARSSRGTPRIALRILRRIRDFIEDADSAVPIDVEFIEGCLKTLGISSDGLDDLDRRYLNCLGGTFGGGPVGLDTLSAALSEARETLSVSVEPYLLREGYIYRTASGRALTDKGRDFAGLPQRRSEKAR